MRPGMQVDSMRLAVLTVLPKMVYLRSLVPTTLPTTGPESIPHRTTTAPNSGLLGSINVFLQRSCTSLQNCAMRTA
eukprot:451258-Rhodomonas_salina.1